MRRIALLSMAVLLLLIVIYKITHGIHMQAVDAVEYVENELIWKAVLDQALEETVPESLKVEVTPGDMIPETAAMPQTLHFVDAWGEWFDADINTEVAGHTYDWNCLENTENGISYEGDERYYIRKGIDVSHHQGRIRWDKVKSAGYDFVILRIGYRGYGESGSLNVDRTFHENIQGAKEAGLDVGVYFFSQAINEEEAIEEAQLVLDNLEGYELELPVVYDPELIRDAPARTDRVTGEQFTGNTITFCEKIREAGYQPMIYSNMYWEAFLFDMKELEDYPVWYADYEVLPQTPYKFELWQYTESGYVNGIDGVTDLDIQFCPRD